MEKIRIIWNKLTLMTHTAIILCILIILDIIQTYIGVSLGIKESNPISFGIILLMKTFMITLTFILIILELRYYNIIKNILVFKKITLFGFYLLFILSLFYFYIICNNFYVLYIMLI